MHVRALRPFCTSPGSWSFPCNHSKVLAEVRLIDKSTPQRNFAQGHIGLHHVPGSQFDATPDHKGVGGVTECGPEGAGKMCFTAPHERA
jgi:hypothetical protein